MKFEKVPQQVLKLKDIKSLVETLRVEINRDLVMVFDLEDHSQRLLQSITELNFKFPKNICKDDFNLFLMIGHSRPLFLYFRLFYLNVHLVELILPLSGLEPRISCAGNNGSTN